jgi:Replication-relaxation
MRDAVGYGELAHLLDSLGDRDRAILSDLARVRVLTGSQLTRLHFSELTLANRERARRRVLARLVEHRLVATLERTIGGVRAGSSGLIHSLGTAGQRALPLLGFDTYSAVPMGRVRPPWTPGSLFLAHSMAIAELYVVLRECERAGSITLAHFVVEAAAWHPDGHSGVIKPDAYVRIHRGEVEDCWWIEVDRATESIPTLRRKLLSYVEFARAGHVGPDEIMPRVLVTVPHDHRLTAVQAMITSLPAPAAELISVALHDQAVNFMIDILRG